MLAFPLSVSQRRLAAVALACLAAALFFLRQHHTAAPAATPLRVAVLRLLRGSSSAHSLGSASLPIVVDCSAFPVERPGLYHLARGSRVADAVAHAGGLTRRAETHGKAVNLAAPVSDGEQVLVAARGGAPPGVGATATAS